MNYLEELNNKKYNKLKIKQIQKLIEENKYNLELLQIINEFTQKCIKENKFFQIETKLKNIISNTEIKIIEVDEYNDIEDSRIENTIELKLNDNTIKIYKRVSISKSENDILEEFYILINHKKIITLYDKDAYKINKQIEDKTLKIKENTFVSNENIFNILHFFELY